MLKLNKILSITIFLTASLGMQSSFADDTTVTENNVMSQPQTTVTDWTKKAQTELTSRMQQKLENQLLVKNHSIELTQLALMLKPVSINNRIVVAENTVVNF